MKRKMNTVRLSIKKTSERTGQYLKEALSSFVESNIYNKKYFFGQRYNFFREKESQYQADHQVIQNLPSRLIEVFAVFGLFVLITINVYNKNSAGLNIITIGAFMAAAYKIIPGIVKILNSIGQAKTYWFTVTGLANENKIATTHTEHQPGIRSVKFDRVSFNYGKEPVLQDLSLCIHKGELTGITGVSGKGKTTMINLLLGFLSPLSGDIVINDASTSADDRKKYW
jgi:ABC-type multidrug transport system fused ATPase/permease subunit